PVEYINSTNARCRSDLHDSRTNSNSSIDNPFGNRFGTLGVLIFAVGSRNNNSSFTNQPKKDFSIVSFLLIVLIALSLLAARYFLTSAVVTCTVAFFTKLLNNFKSRS